MTGPFVIADWQFRMLRDAFAAGDPYMLRVWFDKMDGGVKFKFDNGTWSPPLGVAEQGTD